MTLGILGTWFPRQIADNEMKMIEEVYMDAHSRTGLNHLYLALLNFARYIRSKVVAPPLVIKRESASSLLPRVKELQVLAKLKTLTLGARKKNISTSPFP